ncbi:MAG: hypothetical protein LUG52_09340 [Clostridia bacterium]|nr:hypothetical protein [Clostridia bacterium]
MNDINEKKDIDEIEEIIEKRIAELLDEGRSLDVDDINYYRRDIYKENGWDEDPYPEKGEDDEEFWKHKCITIYDYLSEVGMSIWDFVPRPY